MGTTHSKAALPNHLWRLTAKGHDPTSLDGTNWHKSYSKADKALSDLRAKGGHHDWHVVKVATSSLTTSQRAQALDFFAGRHTVDADATVTETNPTSATPSVAATPEEAQVEVVAASTLSVAAATLMQRLEPSAGRDAAEAFLAKRQPRESDDLAQARGFAAVDVAARVVGPEALRRLGLDARANTLATLPVITSEEGAAEARTLLREGAAAAKEAMARHAEGQRDSAPYYALRAAADAARAMSFAEVFPHDASRHAATAAAALGGDPAPLLTTMRAVRV